MLYVLGSALVARPLDEVWGGTGGTGSVMAVAVPPAFLQQGPVLLAHPEDREPAGRGGEPLWVRLCSPSCLRFELLWE